MESGKLKLVAASFYIPKVSLDELKLGGEDAHFICAEQKTLGVADGVGGWSKQGIDAGEYARELMTNAVIAILNEPDFDNIDLKRVLKKSVEDTKERGSSTACLVTLRDRCLHSLNVGDSGCVVFQNKKFLCRSRIQQTRFNRPFQLGIEQHCDGVDCAEEMKVDVQKGDIVVLGTDGLLDNIYTTEIEDLIRQENMLDCSSNIQILQRLATKIAELAWFHSFDNTYLSPYAKAYQEEFGHRKIGGKEDDITVIVGFIV